MLGGGGLGGLGGGGWRGGGGSLLEILLSLGLRENLAAGTGATGCIALRRPKASEAATMMSEAATMMSATSLRGGAGVRGAAAGAAAAAAAAVAAGPGLGEGAAGASACCSVTPGSPSNRSGGGDVMGDRAGDLDLAGDFGRAALEAAEFALGLAARAGDLLARRPLLAALTKGLAIVQAFPPLLTFENSETHTSAPVEKSMSDSYVVGGVEADLREDGRRRLDLSNLYLETGLIPHAAHSARLALGRTDVLAAVLPELIDAPTGAIAVNVSIAADITHVPPYASLDAAVAQLEAALNALYAPSCIADALAPLTIASSAQCWQLRVHAQLLRCGGCPLDAISLAVRAALHGALVPKIVAAPPPQEGAAAASQLDLDIEESMDESTPFDASSAPIFVTLVTIGAHFVADCTAAEWAAAGSSLSVAVNPRGDVCAIRGGGGCGLHVSRFADMVQSARFLGGGLLEAADKLATRAADDAEARGFPHADGSSRGLVRAPNRVYSIFGAAGA